MIALSERKCVAAKEENERKGEETRGRAEGRGEEGREGRRRLRIESHRCVVVFVSFVSVCVMECLLSMAAALSSDWPAQVRAASRQWLPVKMLIFSVLSPPRTPHFHLLAS